MSKFNKILRNMRSFNFRNLYAKFLEWRRCRAENKLINKIASGCTDCIWPVQENTNDIPVSVSMFNHISIKEKRMVRKGGYIPFFVPSYIRDTTGVTRISVGAHKLPKEEYSNRSFLKFDPYDFFPAVK